MRMLVLGAGQQGSACAYDLLTHTDHEVVIADLNVERLMPPLQPFLGGRLQAVRLDAADPLEVRRALVGVTATMSALPYYFNLTLASAAIEAGSHFCDLGGNTDIVLAQKNLAQRARSRGLSLIADCGLAPGMVNILAEHEIGLLDHVGSVRIMVGGLPQRPDPPLNYQVVYSLEGVLDYYTTPSWVLREGKLAQVEPLTEIEHLEVPGVGELEAFHTAGGLSLMAQRYEGRVESMEYKTLRYPGHADAMRMMRTLGLFELEPVEVKGVRIVPRDAFLAIVGPKLRKDPRESPDLVVLRVQVGGEHGGHARTGTWELVDYCDERTGITAMMRTTGFSLAITGLLQAAGEIAPGAWTSDEVVPAGRYIDELRARGVELGRRETEA